ncbi:MAG: Smr/MutS family protein [Deltaproteobacteria bacterium]|nr:Smr/MutS family protein [Deltaproteobacteria bacterium]
MGFEFCDKKTLTDLEWGAVCEALASRARTEAGRAAALATGFATTRVEVERALALADEARGVLAREGDPPFGGVCDLGAVLLRAEHGQVLEPAELLAVASTLAAAHAVRDYLALAQGIAALLWEVGQRLVPMPQLEARLTRSIDAEGKVADDASPELLRARADARKEKSRVMGRLETILQSPDYVPYLQDSFFTVRDDRFVVPLKASAKNRFGGVLHNASQTGETFFVEPTEIVELNNALRVAEAAAAHEAYRVLLELSQAVSEASGALAENATILTTLDTTFAKAALADAQSGASPAFTDGGDIDLPAARHPILALTLPERGRNVVANSVHIARGSALIVSGQNAGGKTVVLKTVGLVALMAHAGIPVPCGAGATLPILRSVRSDIADEQSLASDLSTFSGQVERVRAVLEDAAPGHLVLFDEIMAGTEPGQGAALAQACLEAFVERGAMVVATTHHDRLKTVSASDARFVNAAVGVDPKTQRPTYALTMGVPGASGAFETARHVGLSEAIVARAVALTGESGQSLDRLLSELQQKSADIDRIRETLTRQTEAAAIAAKAALAARATAERERDAATRAARSEVVASVREAQEKLAAEIRSLQRQGGAAEAMSPRDRAQAVERARKLTDEIEASVRSREDREAKDRFAVGDRVHVATLRRDGVVEALDENRGRADVRIGGLRTTVRIADLEAASTAKAQNEKATPASRPAHAHAALPVAEQLSERLDLRGLRVDEALAELERRLDRAYGAGDATIAVLHGHGTGALKSAVREAVERSPIVRRIRAGETHEGGDAVTIIELKG